MMIDVLSDNIALSSRYGSEHGLSLHIRSGDLNILFDTGAGSLFLENAKKNKIDISKVDLAVISHGHDDHGGGIKRFLEYNHNAPVYVSKHAFGSHYSKRSSDMLEEIGLEKDLALSKRLICLSGTFFINEHIVIFPCENIIKDPSGINMDLFKLVDDKYISDDFLHEQNIVINERGIKVLFTGCAHKGIVNIMECHRNIFNEYPDYVIGGFHLSKGTEDITVIEETGRFFSMTGAVFYTCHCTGLLAYKRLKEILGKKIKYIAAGMKIKI